MIWIVSFLIFTILGVAILFFLMRKKPKILNTMMAEFNAEASIKNMTKTEFKGVESNKESFNLIEMLNFISPSLYTLAKRNDNVFTYKYNAEMPRIYSSEKSSITELILKIGSYLSDNVVSGGFIEIDIDPYKEVNDTLFFNITFKCTGNLIVNQAKMEFITETLNGASLEDAKNELSQIKKLADKLFCELFVKIMSNVFTLEIKAKLNLITKQFHKIDKDFRNIDVITVENAKNPGIEFINNHIKMLGITPQEVKDFPKVMEIINEGYNPDIVIFCASVTKIKTNADFIKAHPTINFVRVIRNPNYEISTKLRLFDIKMPIINDEVEALLAFVDDLDKGVTVKNML